MKKIAVIGGGISGLSIAQCLKENYNVKVFETASKPGGLIKCDRVDGNLYHMVGGHVFNSRREDVLDWFWNFFDRDEEFTKATRNAVVYMDKPIGYPIENHIYQLDVDHEKKIIDDLLSIAKSEQLVPTNFEEFLMARFGNTLYEIYFRPYNEKVWKKDLTKVPLSWLEGKLPMPTIKEIIFNNFHREQETNMVHSSFYYPKRGGSQFLADRLADSLDVTYHCDIKNVKKKGAKWIVNEYECDKVIFCGNIKQFPSIFQQVIDMGDFIDSIANLEFHGTTSVLCEVEKNPFSWIYMPDKKHLSHRIICTGNFADSNNANGKMTATIEFTDYVDKEQIIDNLMKIPFSPKYIDHRYTKFTYPIQNYSTRETITEIKNYIEKENVYLLGRFAEWEYYNMDAAIGAAIDLSKILIGKE